MFQHVQRRRLCSQGMSSALDPFSKHTRSFAVSVKALGPRRPGWLLDSSSKSVHWHICAVTRSFFPFYSSLPIRTTSERAATGQRVNPDCLFEAVISECTKLGLQGVTMHIHFMRFMMRLVHIRLGSQAIIRLTSILWEAY